MDANYMKMAGVASVPVREENNGVAVKSLSAVGILIAVLLVATAFTIGAWGGREYERREAEQAGAGRYVEGEWKYIDGRSAAEYRAVAPHLKPLQ